MMSSWWLMWLVFMFFLFASPVTYGWGYRGWGPPYPSYVQRRRHLQATLRGAPEEADTTAGDGAATSSGSSSSSDSSG